MKNNLNIIIINDRVENIYNDYLNKFDLVTARAVTNMRVLSELSLPLVKKDGFMIAMKGNIESELNEALNTINKMNGNIILKKKFTLYNNEGKRTILKSNKTKKY